MVINLINDSQIMFIKKIILDLKTYLSINYLNQRRYPDSNIECYIHKGLKINSNSTIKKGVILSEKLNEIGTGTYIGNNSTVLNCSTIGNFCSISHDVKIGLDNHDLNGLSTSPLICKMNIASPTIIEHDVLISANVVVLAGVTIGTGSVIGANSFVNSDIPPFSIAVGSPAKVIKKRFSELVISQLLTSNWWGKPLSEIKLNINEYQNMLNKDDSSK